MVCSLECMHRTYNTEYTLYVTLYFAVLACNMYKRVTNKEGEREREKAEERKVCKRKTKQSGVDKIARHKTEWKSLVFFLVVCIVVVVTQWMLLIPLDHF